MEITSGGAKQPQSVDSTGCVFTCHPLNIANTSLSPVKDRFLGAFPLIFLPSLGCL